MKTGDRVYSKVENIRFFGSADARQIWQVIDDDELESAYGFDDAHTPYRFSFERSQRIGTISEFKRDADGVTFAKLNVEGVHYDDGHDAFGWFGASTPSWNRPFTIVAWVLADDIVDETGLVQEYVPIKPPVPPKTDAPKTDTPKTDTPKTDTKSLFKQTDKTTGEEKPNYILYGGIFFGLILIVGGLYWAFGSSPQPQPTIQYVPQPQPIK